jgi:hypothetical protein
MEQVMRVALKGALALVAGVGVWVAFVLVRLLWWRVRRRKPALLPESLFRVSVSRDHITCDAPDGTRSAVAWKDITLVKIKTTSAGPWEPDVFWIFESWDQRPALMVVGGATGEQEMIEALNHRLPGFNDRMVIKAMGSTSNREFICWQASSPSRHASNHQRHGPRPDDHHQGHKAHEAHEEDKD